MGITKYDHSLHARFNMTDDDECYYFIEATQGGFEASTSNSLLLNFKKDIKFKKTPAWQYRNNAIKQFALMISKHINNDRTDSITIIPEATSYPISDPSFNDRLVQTLIELKKLRQRINIELALEAKSYIGSSHLPGGTRNVPIIQNNLQWKGLKNSPSQTIILLDDVLTTGAHFRACKNIILANTPENTNIIGFFLALYN